MGGDPVRSVSRSVQVTAHSDAEKFGFMVLAMLSVLLLSLASLGGGAVMLHGLGFWHGRDLIERSAMAFALGFGLIGWILFWFGISTLLNGGAIWILGSVLALGNILHWTVPGNSPGIEISNNWLRILLVVLAAVFLTDGIEAISPPIDADTLAYHFTLPRQFIENGAIFFQPVAFTGAIPLLVHMTYAAAIATGGEISLTLWTFVTGWAAAILLFAVARRWMSDGWALSVALVFQTMPAVIYGAGTGQVEVRLALFVLVATIGLVELRHSGGWKPVVLVAMGSGLFLGAKLTGVFFVTIIAIVILALPGPRIKRFLAFCGVVAIVASQWYGWNFLHTGDPLFPMLYDLAVQFNLANPAYWNDVHEQFFRNYLSVRGAVVEGTHWILTYPIIATLNPLPQFGSGRIGLGPFFLLAAPMSLYGIWHLRDRLLASRLLPIGLVLIGFYFLWINLGGIPKVRHVLPLIPVLLICVVVPAVACDVPWLKRAVALSITFSVLIGLGAQVFYARPLLALHFGSLDRTSFLRQNVMSYPAVEAINKLDGVTKVFLWDRQTQFYIEYPTFFAAPYAQTLIQNAEGNVEPTTFFNDLRRNEISHIISRRLPVPAPDKTADWAIKKLAERGCVHLVKSTPYSHFNSRTLKSIWNSQGFLDIWRLSPSCDGSEHS